MEARRYRFVSTKSMVRLHIIFVASHKPLFRCSIPKNSHDIQTATDLVSPKFIFCALHQLWDKKSYHRERPFKSHHGKQIGGPNSRGYYRRWISWCDTSKRSRRPFPSRRPGVRSRSEVFRAGCCYWIINQRSKCSPPNNSFCRRPSSKGRSCEHEF